MTRLLGSPQSKKFSIIDFMFQIWETNILFLFPSSLFTEGSNWAQGLQAYLSDPGKKGTKESQ